ncbi:tyrosine--tRNA ligase, partial [Candidatus Woesebacteria bacterium]|nr:tyrosine--tRNA ligase [Candidatus Woesebacteria bacterium]
DTSDKDTERPVLTSEQIQANFETYKKQAEKVLDFSKIRVVYNSEWLKPLQFADIVKLCQHFSTGEFVSRELIKKRLTDGKKVGLHELLYPVMQGYDSYFMDTDIQLGGTDQTFNMQAGRVLQKDLRAKESFIIANGFLEGTDGRKMSKSWGNGIWLTDEPNEMFGKVMSLKDSLIISYFTLATNISMNEIEEIKKQLLSENPMEIKKRLAHQLVTELHSKEFANSAQHEFETRFQKGDLGESHLDTKSIQLLKGDTGVSIVSELQFASSNSEARRLIAQNSVSINDVVLTNPTEKITLKENDIFKVGRKAVKITK